jgi:hypothetical protein
LFFLSPHYYYSEYIKTTNNLKNLFTKSSYININWSSWFNKSIK